MREERLVRSAAAALTAQLCAFMALYFTVSYAFALTAFLYGLLCALLGILTGWFLGQKHAAWQILTSALAAALAALALPIALPSALVARLILMGCGVVLAVWAERLFISPVAGPPGPALLLAPLIALFVLSISLRLSGRPQDGARALSLAVGSIWLVVALFTLNRASVLAASRAQKRGELPPGMRRGGAWGAAVFLAATFALANARAILDLIGAAIRAILLGFVQLMEFLSGLMSPAAAPMPSGMPGGPQPTIPPAGGGESKLGEILRWIGFGLIALALLAAALWGLCKWIPKLWRRLKERLARLFATWREEDAGYSDRTERLMTLRQAMADAGARVRKLAGRFRRRPTLADFPTNAGKARFLFGEYLRSLLSAGRAPMPRETPTEIARSAPPLAHAYNRARYASEEPSDEQIAQAAQAVHPKRKQAF